MTSAAVLLVYALAVARVTRLINEDVLLNGPRDRLVSWAWARKYGTGTVGPTSISEPFVGYGAQAVPLWQAARQGGALEPKLAYLITCPWCASIYVWAVAAPLWYWLGGSPWVLVPAAALAFSYIAGFLAQHGE